MAVLAHFGHWYHAFLYVAPVVVVAAGLWIAGKRMPEGAEDDLDEDGDAFLDAPR